MEQTFAAYLTAALRQIKRREGKNLAIIQDELGYALGRESGGSVIEFWRKGNLPASLSDLEQLGVQLQQRGGFDLDWLHELLRLGQHPYPDQFCQQVGQQFTTTSAEPVSRPAVRAPTSDFAGRSQELAQLSDLLRQPAPHAVVVAIRGMGGAGKSELAYRIARDVQEHFPDGQLFVPLHATSTPGRTADDALRRSLTLLGIDVAPQMDYDVLIARYTSALAGRRMLIIVDDVHDPAQVSPLIPPVGSALLITSRRRFSLPGMVTLDLDMLDPAAARALVLEICPRIAAHADHLSQLCGYLPLALRISASELATDDTQDIPTYLERLSDTRERLNHLRAADNAQLDVAASLHLSLDALPASARRGLAALAVCPAGFTRALADALLPADADADILGLLRRHSLLDYDPQTARYSLHDLVRSLAIAQLADPDATWLRYGAACLSAAKAATAQYKLGGAAIPAALQEFDQLLPHLLAVWDWLLEQPPQPERDELAVELATTTIFLGDLRFDTRQQRIPQLRHALQAAQRRTFELEQFVCAVNLGRAYMQLYDFESAEAYFTVGLELTRTTGHRRAEANVLNNLAQVAIERSQFALARTQLDAALAIASEIDDHFGQAASLNNLGVICLCQGRFSEAEQFMQRSIASNRAVGYERGSAWALSYLGLIHINQGAFATADEVLERGLAIARTLGDRAVETRLLAYQGWLALLKLEVANARSLLETAYEQSSSEDAWSNRHWITGKLALLAFMEGHQPRSLRLYEQRLREAPTPHDWGLAEDSRILGQLLLKIKHPAGESIYQRWREYVERAEYAAQSGTAPEELGFLSGQV